MKNQTAPAYQNNQSYLIARYALIHALNHNDTQSLMSLATKLTYARTKLATNLVGPGEIGLLLFGIYLIYKLRNASSDAHKEKLVLSASVFIELLISTLTYIIRHMFWERLSSDQLLVLHCIRCHLTVTLTVSLVFGPKVSRITLDVRVSARDSSSLLLLLLLMISARPSSEHTNHHLSSSITDRCTPKSMLTLITPTTTTTTKHH